MHICYLWLLWFVQTVCYVVSGVVAETSYRLAPTNFVLFGMASMIPKATFFCAVKWKIPMPESHTSLFCRLLFCRFDHQNIVSRAELVFYNHRVVWV